MPARLKGTSVAADPGPQLLLDDDAEAEQVVDPQQVKLKVYVVQHGLSKAQTSHGQLMLPAVTERFLSDVRDPVLRHMQPLMRSITQCKNMLPHCKTLRRTLFKRDRP